MMEEKVQVEKTPVVREEVSLRKQQVQGTRQVSDTVKREEAWVDTTGEADVRTGSSRPWQGQERRRNDSSTQGGIGEWETGKFPGRITPSAPPWRHSGH